MGGRLHHQAVVDIEEELEVELVELVHLVQGLDREVDGATGGGLGQVLP